MIELEYFEHHLRSIPTKEWNKLFSLLTLLEDTNKSLLDKSADALANYSAFSYNVYQCIHALNIVPIFDWTSWDEGKTILNSYDYNYATLDNVTLCKLLTIIVRNDRFIEGYFEMNFENGVIPKIIQAIKTNIMKRSTITLRKIKSALYGVCVADALGVPVEFNSRQMISNNPVKDMIGYGTYNLPPGTWSDDSSLTFCLAEALTQDFDLNVIGQNFVKWYVEKYWTPYGHVFDIGIATSQAISRIKMGEKPEKAGGFGEGDNGNGSLMRILPLLFYLVDKPVQARFEITKSVSSITHGHIRSVIACFYYLEFAMHLLTGKDKFEIYKILQTDISNHLINFGINPIEIEKFDSLLKHDISKLHVDEIQSSGYVLHTLEASIWCLLTTKNYKDAVLKAVNLGSDTDTTAAVTGGLAGLLYGLDGIPKKWLLQIIKFEEIENLADRLYNKMAIQ